MGRSAFTAFFDQLLEDVTKQSANEMDSNEDNLYFCLGIIDFLFQNYLSINLWSGLLLVNLKRYASDEENGSTLCYCGDSKNP